MKISVTGLSQLCQTNLVEFKFTRRLRYNGMLPTRRMLATLDGDLLNSTLGKEILHFKPPTHISPYNATSKGLLTVWDLLFQDWRSIPVDSSLVIASVPTKPVEIFWEYFDKVIGKMTSAQKAVFMSK